MARLIVFVLMSASFATAGPIAWARDASPSPGLAVEVALSGVVAPRAQNEVLVLGTAHLSAFADRLRPEHLESTIALLERFSPTRIAVESITADEIALLAERAARDEAAEEVVDMFVRTALEHGQTMQRVLETDRVAAATRADEMLEDEIADDDVEKRLPLIGYLLAAYEYDTAALHWSWLSPEARAGATVLPEPIKAWLDRYLESGNENVTVAMPLARGLGLRRLVPIDSQYEAVRTLSFPRETLETVFAQAYAEESEASGRVRAAPQAALENGDLLPLYRYQNSYQGQVDHAQEWIAWLKMNHASGLDRFRYAMWELRNQRMAVNIMNAAASPEPQRLLVIVGAAHKSYIDRALLPNLSVRLKQLDEFDEPAAENGVGSR